VDQFKSASDRQRALLAASADTAAFQNENRTQPLAASEDAVSHRFVNPLGKLNLGWQMPLE
jgi:hypothetical protein